ncbi:MAG TPA: flagellar hook-associated protein FlgL [Patescibacteria group bacterium]|nr:flagellar hook-associated protein FlgL [Patescibacteria group bacterium]
MRVTNSMLSDAALWNISKNTERLNKVQTQVSSQSKIQLPSDDPVVATRAIKYRNYVSSVDQYQKNVDDATSWQEVSDDALSDLGDAVKRLRELTVEASSDALSDEDLADIKTEVEELKNTVVDTLNTSYAGRYVFAGYATGDPPYAIDESTGKVTFKGSYLSPGSPTTTGESSDADLISDFTSIISAGDEYTFTSSQSIKYNVGFGSKAIINVEGQDVTGYSSTYSLSSNSSNLFDTIDKLLIGLDGEDSYTITGYGVQGTTEPDYTALTGTSFTMTLQTLDDTGATVNTDYTVDCSSVTDLESLQEAVDAAVGTNVVSVVSDANSGYLTFTAATGSDLENITLSDPTSGTSALTALGSFTSGATQTVTTVDVSFTIDDLLDEFDADYNTALTAQAALGARMNFVDMASTRLSNNDTTYTELMSNNEDVDTAEASIALTSAEYVYEASLSVASNVTSKTLVDYLA